MDEITQGSVQGTNEATTETAKTETPKDDYVDRFTRLAQLDKAQRIKDSDIKNKMKDLQSRELSMKDKIDMAELFDKDPLAVLKKRGIDINKLYSDSINNLEIEDDPIRKELAEIKLWKQSEEKFKEDAKTSAQQREETELNEKKTNYVAHLSEFVKANEEKYPLLSSFEDASDKIYEVIATAFDETGKVLTPEEASAHLQNELVTMYKTVLNKKGVAELFNLMFKDTDNAELESIFKPESGVTIDQSFKPVTAQSSPSGNEEQRRQAAIKITEQMFKSNNGF